MSGWARGVLRVVMAVALTGSVVVQVVMVALLWSGTDGSPSGIGVALVAIGVLGVATLQVIAVCIWRLLTMVGLGTVFSQRAFRYVDIIIGAIATASVLMLGTAVVARFANHAVPEDAVAPELVGLLCGLALAVGGVALLVYVLRTLLVQAVALHAEANHLRSELDEVI